MGHLFNIVKIYTTGEIYLSSYRLHGSLWICHSSLMC